jgi:hypothetical protein
MERAVQDNAHRYAVEVMRSIWAVLDMLELPPAERVKLLAIATTRCSAVDPARVSLPALDARDFDDVAAMPGRWARRIPGLPDIVD